MQVKQNTQTKQRNVDSKDHCWMAELYKYTKYRQNAALTKKAYFLFLCSIK